MAIILARVDIEKEFVEYGGRYNDTPFFKDVPVAKACLWTIYDSNEELRKARQYAKKEGFTVIQLPDSEDVLKKAKDKMLEIHAKSQKRGMER